MGMLNLFIILATVYVAFLTVQNDIEADNRIGYSSVQLCTVLFVLITYTITLFY